MLRQGIRGENLKTILVLFICFMGSYAFGQYRVKHYCETAEALQQISDQIIIDSGQARFRFFKIPPLGTPEFIEYQSNKKCFSHAKRPSASTLITDLKWVGQIEIEDSVDSTPWKIELYEGELDFSSRKAPGFVFSPPCRPDQHCVNFMEKDKHFFMNAPNETQDCTDWPTGFHGSLPKSALAGLEVGFRFRTNCLLGKRFRWSGVKARMVSEVGRTLWPVFKQSFYVPAGFELHRIAFQPPEDLARDNYHIQGCFIVTDSLYALEKCIPLPLPEPYHPLDMVP